MGSRYSYDEAASARLRMDVVHEVPDSPPTASQWSSAMRLLNTDDPLTRKLVALHRECGSGTGVCDGIEDVQASEADQWHWGCGTLEILADHHAVTP